VYEDGRQLFCSSFYRDLFVTYFLDSNFPRTGGGVWFWCNPAYIMILGAREIGEIVKREPGQLWCTEHLPLGDVYVEFSV